GCSWRRFAERTGNATACGAAHPGGPESRRRARPGAAAGATAHGQPCPHPPPRVGGQHFCFCFRSHSALSSPTSLPLVAATAVLPSPQRERGGRGTRNHVVHGQKLLAFAWRREDDVPSRRFTSPWIRARLRSCRDESPANRRTSCITATSPAARTRSGLQWS